MSDQSVRSHAAPELSTPSLPVRAAALGRVRPAASATARPAAFLAALVVALVATPALAHGGHLHPGERWWQMWQTSPEILLGIALAGWIYRRGSRDGQVREPWRQAAFYGGLFALFVALVSPVERLADHIFAVHQVEHMLLRTTAPMLLFLSRPQAAMVRGTPGAVSRFFAGSGALRAVIDALRHPVVATVLFLASSYVWMTPRLHDLAILDEPVHYCWHITLLVSGLLFFSVIFERRSPPHAPGLGPRLAMFAVAALGNIVLGAFLSLKTVPLYTAYLTLGHMWHVSMLTDEQTGGIIMWIPGTMMLAISAILVIHRFSSEEEAQVERRRRAGRAGPAKAKGANGALAFGLAGFAVLVLALAVSVVAVIDHPRSASRDFGLAGQVPG